MENVCPKCQSTEVVEIHGLYINKLAVSSIFGSEVSEGIPSTKYVCTNCGKVVEEKMNIDDIKKYAARK
jgi:transposase